MRSPRPCAAGLRVDHVPEVQVAVCQEVERVRERGWCFSVTGTSRTINAISCSVARRGAVLSRIFADGARCRACGSACDGPQIGL